MTYGVDDTVKAAGHRKHDVKTTHITIIDEHKDRETFSSGFYPNASHAGESAAETIKLDIAKMAVLTNNAYKDMFNLIDFFMTDRAGDSNVMLDTLEVDEKKRLKCNAHVLLAIDVALDKIFKDSETQIGVSNLIDNGASHVFNSPKSSVWLLGLIAVAKLLSPSHNAETISLHKEYCHYLSQLHDEKGNALKNEFKGFISNRFGRVGELSHMVIKHIDHIREFFDEFVDENANKLVLAVDSYIKSEWFLTCCEIANKFYTEITVEVKKLIGMDEFKNTKSEQRSWGGIKKEFNRILESLNATAQTKSDTGKEKLISKAAANIRDAMKRQLNMVHFFTNAEDEELNAPITNLGCEGVFSGFGNDCKHAGGSTSLKTISNKSVTSNNKLYTKERWKTLPENERREKFKWARSSDAAKKVKGMEKEFLVRVNAVSEAAIESRRQKKQKKLKKVIENLELCKIHGGPLTAKDIDRLDDLTAEEVLVEAKYLKKTVASNIRLKRKVDRNFVNFTNEEIKQQIREVIKPSQKPQGDVDSLLQKIYRTESLIDGAASNEKSDQKSASQIGSVGFWKNQLGETMFGVLVDTEIIQLYKKSRYGMVPFGLPVDAELWSLEEIITDYGYEQRGNKLYLVF